MAQRPSPRLRGEALETVALNHLCRQGLRPVCRNFQCRLGEIDLIMRDGASLVFVEVRYRAGNSHG